MEAKNSGSVLPESSHRFLNRAFVKGFLAGFVLGISFYITGMIWNLIDLDGKIELVDVESFQFLPLFIVICALPLLIIYLVGMVVKFALGRYGFEGWEKGEMTFVDLFGGLLGMFAVPVVIIVFVLILAVVRAFIMPGG